MRDNELQIELNFDLIEELNDFFNCNDQNKVIEKLILFSEKAFGYISPADFINHKNIWIGLSNYQNTPKIIVKSISGNSYKDYHELYRTDANVLIGFVKFNHALNKFEPNHDLHFFIESWEGNASGVFDSLKIEFNNFRYLKTS